MPTIEAGRLSGRVLELECTGSTDIYGDHGCGVNTLVPESDLYETDRCQGYSISKEITFCCTYCGAESYVPESYVPVNMEALGERPDEKKRLEIKRRFLAGANG